MHTLLLSRNPIGADGLLALLEAVAPRGAGCPLQVLALANCEVSGLIAPLSGNALTHARSCVSAQIGVPVVSPLRAWLSTPGLRLHTLDLSGNAIGSGDASVGESDGAWLLC